MKVAVTYQKPQTISLHVDGISCHSCVRAIESAVKNVPGVDSVHVNFATNQATVVAQSPADECTIIAAIDHAGYRASPIASEGSQNVHSGHISEEKTSLIRLLAAIFLSLPFFVEMIGMLLGLGVGNTHCYCRGEWLRRQRRDSFQRCCGHVKAISLSRAAFR